MKTHDIKLLIASDLDADILRVEVWVDKVLLMDVTNDIVTIFGPTPTEVSLDTLINALIDARQVTGTRSQG